MTVHIPSPETPDSWSATFHKQSLLNTSVELGAIRIPIGAEYIRWGAIRSPGQTTSEAWVGGTGGANLQLQVTMFDPLFADAWKSHPDTSNNTLTAAGYSGSASAVGYTWARAVVSQTGATTENAMIDIAFRLG